MPINPAIAMGVRGIELADPLAQYGRVAAIQGAQQQNQLAQLQMQQAMREQESTNALNAAYRDAYNPQTGDIDLNKLRQSLSAGGFGSKLPGIEKTLAELKKERLTQQKLEGEIAAQPVALRKLESEIVGQGLTQKKLEGEISAQPTALAIAQANLVEAKLKQARSFLDTIDPTDPTAPEKYIAWHEANHRDPVLGPLLASRGITADQSRAQIAQAIQQGPKAFADLLNRSKIGTEKFMELAATTRGQDMAAATAAAGQAITQRGQDLTANAAARRLAFDQQKFAWEKANPGYELKESADGTIYAVNKRTLQATPVTIGGASNALAPAPGAANALVPGAAPGAAPAAVAPSAPTPAVSAAPGAVAPGTPLKGKGKELAVTEQQASYNVGRILDAAKEINAAVQKDPGAFKPGALEAASSSMGAAGAANAARNAQRQIVYGAQRDALDAMLYLATGAAYNREQLEGQMAAYMPAFTDKPEALEAKRKRMLGLIQNAKTRAGKAWTPELEKSLNVLMQPAAAQADGATGGNLSPAEQAELDQLRARFGKK